MKQERKMDCDEEVDIEVNKEGKNKLNLEWRKSLNYEYNWNKALLEE